jgi:hypothetical protein
MEIDETSGKRKSMAWLTTTIIFSRFLQKWVHAYVCDACMGWMENTQVLLFYRKKPAAPKIPPTG